MLKLALILDNYPIILGDQIQGISDIRLHVILPRYIDITRSNNIFKVAIKRFSFNGLVFTVSFLLSTDLYNISNTVTFDAFGCMLNQATDSQFTLYKYNSYIEHNITLPIMLSNLNSIIHPSCCVFLLKQPLIAIYNSKVLCTALKYPSIANFTYSANLDVNELKDGINTNVSYNDYLSTLVVNGVVNQNKPTDWTNLWWLDIALVYFNGKPNLDLLSYINNSTKGLTNINGLSLSLYALGSSSVFVFVTYKLNIGICLYISTTDEPEQDDPQDDPLDDPLSDITPLQAQLIVLANTDATRYMNTAADAQLVILLIRDGHIQISNQLNVIIGD